MKAVWDPLAVSPMTHSIFVPRRVPAADVDALVDLYDKSLPNLPSLAQEPWPPPGITAVCDSFRAITASLSGPDGDPPAVRAAAQAATQQAFWGMDEFASHLKGVMDRIIERGPHPGIPRHGI